MQASRASIPDSVVLRFEGLSRLLASGRVVMPRGVSRVELPRADSWSFASAPEALLGPYSAALGSPQRSRAALNSSSALLPIPIVASCGPRVDLRSSIRRC